MTPEWYNKSSGFFGNMKVHYFASLSYATISLTPLLLYIIGYNPLNWMPTRLGFFWALTITLGYPVWSWCETIEFEKWARTLTAEKRESERFYYGLMRNHAKGFWTSLLAIYSIAGLWNLVLK